MVPALTPLSELGQDIDWSSGQGGEEQGSQLEGSLRVLAEGTKTLVFAVKAARLGLGVCGELTRSLSTGGEYHAPARASTSGAHPGSGPGWKPGWAWVPRTGAPSILP